jgi:hypothetical protein
VYPSQPSEASFQSILRTKEGKVVKEYVGQSTRLDWMLDDIEGWYPIGYGTQSLYELEITILDTVRFYSDLANFRIIKF